MAILRSGNWKDSADLLLPYPLSARLKNCQATFAKLLIKCRIFPIGYSSCPRHLTTLRPYHCDGSGCIPDYSIWSRCVQCFCAPSRGSPPVPLYLLTITHKLWPWWFRSARQDPLMQVHRFDPLVLAFDDQKPPWCPAPLMVPVTLVNLLPTVGRIVASPSHAILRFATGSIRMILFGSSSADFFIKSIFWKNARKLLWFKKKNAFL